MLPSGFPIQYLQEQLDDLYEVTPPHKRDLMEDFGITHRAVCERVGVKWAPETDKVRVFSSETSGKVLGVVYETEMWS